MTKVDIAEEIRKFKVEKGLEEPQKTDAGSAAEFEWIQLNQTLGEQRSTEDTKVETSKDKMKRKFQENPLIPIGFLATAGCLIVGLGKFARKDSHGSQMMMRGRIAAQGFTIFAMLGGVVFSMKKNLTTNKS